MNKKDLLICFFLFLIGILSRAPLIEHMQSHWDGPQFSIALVRGFNFSQETPAPLGYPLYVALGEVFYQVVHDPHLALLIESVLFSGIAVAIIFLTGKIIFNRAVGFVAALIFLSGSTFYYFGITIYGYIMMMAFTPLLAVLVYQIMFKKRQYGIAMGIIYAVALGFRPQEAIYTLPLFLLGFFYLPWKEKVKTGVVFTVVFLAWFVPYVKIASGNLFKYIVDLSQYASAGALPEPSVEHAIQTNIIIFQGLYLSFAFANLALLYYPVFAWKKYKKSGIAYFIKHKKQILFYAIWILPCFLFNVFVRTEHAGYQLSYLSCLLFLISYALWQMFRKHQRLLMALVAFCVVANLVIFFYDRDPTYSRPFRQSSLHYSDIRRNDRQLSTKVNFIKSRFNPKTTLILMGPFFWRHTMYYLPEYRILELDALVTEDPRFSFIRRDTYNWIRRQYETKDRSFIVPRNIRTIVVLDEGYDWVKVANRIIYQLPWNVKMVSFPVTPGQRINYSFQSITKAK